MEAPTPSISVIRTYRYRLLPRRKQHLALARMLEMQRQLYNGALQERVDAFRRTGRSTSRNDQYKSLTTIRSDDPDGYGALPANMSRETLRRLDEAYCGFFRRTRSGEKPGFPRYKSKKRWRSFGFAEFSGITFVRRSVRFKGMPGALRVHVHRPLPAGAQFLSCQVCCNANAWSISLQVRETIQILPHAGSAVGIDLGVDKFATLSDGVVIPSLRVARRAEAVLQRAQRRLMRARRESASRRRRKQVLARLYLKTVNARDTYLHQVSARLARRYSLIGLEALHIRDICGSKEGRVSRQSALNRSILDAGWGRFCSLVRYKAAWAGSRVVEVDPKYTSQRCSSCSALVAKDLADRVHRCTCGLVLDRDLNAAHNILKLALTDSRRAPKQAGARP